MRERFHLPVAFRHPVALVGAFIATAMGVLFVTLFLVDAVGLIRNPYFGLLLFVAVPAAFVIGLLIIPLGMQLDARRRRRDPGVPPPDWPVFDFRIARHRQITAIVGALTIVNLVVVSLASYGAVHYRETRLREHSRSAGSHHAARRSSRVRNAGRLGAECLSSHERQVGQVSQPHRPRRYTGVFPMP